jgi:chloramphenicol 3-O phosphotransferase
MAVGSPAGGVILVNGTSSAGKTTIARAVQRLADEMWLRLGIDSFWSSVDERWMEYGDRAAEGFRWVERDDQSTEIIPGPQGQRLASSMRAAVAAAARAGTNVIADDVLLDRNWIGEWTRALAGLDVLFVGVRTSLAVLEERERRRGDRILGESRAQIDVIHDGLRYDLEVDGSADPEASARAVLDAFRCVPHPRALERVAAG